MRTGVKKSKNSLKIISFKSSCRFENFFILANIFIAKHFRCCYPQYHFLDFLCFHVSCFCSFAFYLLFLPCLLTENCCCFLFQKFVNVFFIVMTIKAKSLWYFSSSVHLFLRGSPISSGNDFLATWGFLLLSATGFFRSSNVGTIIRLSVFSPLSHGYIYVTWFKMKFTYQCIIYI